MQRQHIDAHIRSITPNLQLAIQTGNLDWFWETYWATIELAIFDFTNFSHKGTEQDALGRGRSTIRKVTHQPLFAAGLEGNHETQQPSWLLHLAKQGNRTKHLATCYHVLAKGKATGDKLERLKNDIGAATTNCLRYFHAACSSPDLFGQPGQGGGPPPRFQDVIDLLAMPSPPPLRAAIALDLAAERLKQIHHQQLVHHNATIIEQRKEQRRLKERSMGDMCKDVRGASCPPLLRLREGVNGKDTIQTHPLEVDRVLRESLGAIYCGNASVQRQQHMLDTFLAKFGKHCTRQPAMHVDPITADMLAEIIAAMPDSTPGLDGIRKGDLLLLSPLALE